MNRRLRAVLVATVVLFVPAISFLAVPSAPAGADPAPVSGGGSSFAQLEMDQWRADTAHAPYNLKLDYAAQGSSFGRNQFLSGQFDYGVSDIEFQPDDHVETSPRGKNFTYIPVSAGGVGFMYNLKDLSGQRITNLHLTAVDVCRAFTEQNIYWDDPSIMASNPGTALPHHLISRKVRSDGSGTSYVFSEYCKNVAPQVWTAFIAMVQRVAGGGDIFFNANQPTSQWPSGYGNVGAFNAADGVANAVASDVTGNDSITYNAAGFGQERGMPNAYIQNAAGVYHLPDATGASVALAYADPQPDGTFHLKYTVPDPNAYFPSTYSYVIAQTTGFDPDKGATLGTFLNYAVTAGQKRAVPLGYARLSTILVNEALDHIQLIPGAPPRPTDLGNPPPPPPKNTLSPAAAAAANAAAAAKAAGGKGGTASGSSGAGGTGATGAGGPGVGGTGAPGAAVEGAVVNADGTVSGAAGSAAALGPLTEIADDSPQSKDVSNKDALWFFLLGFGLVGLGSVVGVGSVVANKSARGQGTAS